MKILKDILYKTRIEEVQGSTEVTIDKLCFNSAESEQYSLFIAIKGTNVDGHKYIQDAIEKGAVAIVCEEFPQKIQEDVTYVKVLSSSAALGEIASNFYGNPSEKLKLIGVTGTNGKTTVVSLLFELFRELKYKTGMFSTVEYRIHNELIPSTHTTPDAIALNKMLARMVEEGVSYCFMEVSSHSIVQNRITGLHFAGGVFMNITHDHLDYHGSFDNYIAAKKAFFDVLPESAFALVNKDDRHSSVMIQNCKARKWTFGLKSDADFKGKILENQFTGLNLIIDGNDVWSKLVGSFNASNLLSVYGVANLLEQERIELLTCLSALEPVAGRFQHVKAPGNIVALVDYAHTPDALEKVLLTIKDIRTGAEQVITVVGCGGDRDKEKRPLMADIAAKYSNHVILTSDNPRNEDPAAIIEDMKKGLDPIGAKKTVVNLDRKEAIKMACALAHTGDVVLVAGKGHEKYQEIKGEKHPFDDVKILDETLKTYEG